MHCMYKHVSCLLIWSECGRREKQKTCMNGEEKDVILSISDWSSIPWTAVIHTCNVKHKKSGLNEGN